MTDDRMDFGGRDSEPPTLQLRIMTAEPSVAPTPTGKTALRIPGLPFGGRIPDFDPATRTTHQYLYSVVARNGSFSARLQPADTGEYRGERPTEYQGWPLVYSIDDASGALRLFVSLDQIAVNDAVYLLNHLAACSIRRHGVLQAIDAWRTFHRRLARIVPPPAGDFIHVNLRGDHLTLQAAAAQLTQQGAGQVIEEGGVWRFVENA